jgi:hypothetical protein
MAHFYSYQKGTLPRLSKRHTSTVIKKAHIHGYQNAYSAVSQKHKNKSTVFGTKGLSDFTLGNKIFQVFSMWNRC